LDGKGSSLPSRRIRSCRLAGGGQLGRRCRRRAVDSNRWRSLHGSTCQPPGTATPGTVCRPQPHRPGTPPHSNSRPPQPPPQRTAPQYSPCTGSSPSPHSHCTSLGSSGCLSRKVGSGRTGRSWNRGRGRSGTRRGSMFSRRTGPAGTGRRCTASGSSLCILCILRGSTAPRTGAWGRRSSDRCRRSASCRSGSSRGSTCRHPDSAAKCS
jgi:hypothetical protein